uniref:Platelet-derived growth factor (PDGF) family profile domain-containing protein n=1 Tax=Poecilia reticulata TaxID=8081 RepID=A0A3P9PM99_POERE
GKKPCELICAVSRPVFLFCSIYDPKCLLTFFFYVALGFTEVLIKSLCRPIEQYVDVEKEFPKEFEGFYIPRCVSLFRCSSCCLDESRECSPVVERNITLEVSWLHQVINLTFVEHLECGVSCSPFLGRNSIKIIQGHNICICRVTTSDFLFGGTRERGRERERERETERERELEESGSTACSTACRASPAPLLHKRRTQQ